MRNLQASIADQQRRRRTGPKGEDGLTPAVFAPTATDVDNQLTDGSG